MSTIKKLHLTTYLVIQYFKIICQTVTCTLHIYTYDTNYVYLSSGEKHNILLRVMLKPPNCMLIFGY